MDSPWSSSSPALGPGGFEPALPRRKKNPALAYKTHEFLAMSDGVGSSNSLDASVVVDRARMITTVPPSGGAFKNAISRISTEYRLQFAWPKGSKDHSEDRAAAGAGPPRKSLSMGAIKPAGAMLPLTTAIAAVHKKRITDADRKYGAELEPLVGWNADTQDDRCGQDDEGEEKIQEESLSKEEKSQSRLSRAEFHSEYKKKFRPFSQYDYVGGQFKAKKSAEPEPLIVHELGPGDSWYREVLELRKKAGEYKHRGWGTELVPQHIAELYNKQMTLWEQVSRRSSLSALSLASTTPRSISKEEKEKENNKKSSPTKPPWSRQSPSRHVSPQKKVDKTEDNKKESSRSRKEAVIRHHLERTTGAGRSQSVGPATTYSSENRSPKRLPRGPASKPQVNGPATAEKRTRPKEDGGGEEDLVDGGQEAEEAVEVEPPVDLEPVVKSPPEPTRVKSPEQILMRSPEPVNWTVPLDTGKTFTVTQNVHEGDLIARPHSEVKAWTPPTAPPVAPQSAPPQLAEAEG